MRIDCECGSEIHDSTDSLPHKAHVLADQQLWRFLDVVRDAIKLSGPTPDEKNKAYMQVHVRFQNLKQLAWQCINCGRIYIDDENGNMHVFVPAAEKTSKEVFHRKPVIGLLGGIGSGKSLVAAELVKHGGRIVSGDQAGHEALRQPEIKKQLVQRWGNEVLDGQGEVIRRKVGAIVFGNPAELKVLEELVHPYIGKKLREEIETARRDPAVKFVILDAAIMLEAGWNNVCDRLVYIDAPRDVRYARLARQRGWAEKEVQAREAAQMPLEGKQQRADATVDNGGSPDETARQVTDLLARWGLA